MSEKGKIRAYNNMIELNLSYKYLKNNKVFTAVKRITPYGFTPPQLYNNRGRKYK